MADTIAEIRRKIWLAERPRTPPVATMLSLPERRLLHHLTHRHFGDSGAIVDAGCFLGGSTVALAAGLRRWSAAAGRAPTHKIQTYDLFAAEAWTIGRFLPEDMQPGDSFRALFDANVAPYRDLVEVHQGDITSATWPGWPVEILFVDCAKVPTVNDYIAQAFFPRLIPGISIVVQQDYLFDSWNAWLHLTMERLSDYFEILTDTGLGSIVYLNTRAIPEAEIAAAAVGRMSAAEKLSLLDRARGRFTGYQAFMLERSHASYLRGPAWCTGVDVEGHLAAFACIVDAELARVRPMVDADLAGDIDTLRRALAAPAGNLAGFQSALDRLAARIEAALAAHQAAAAVSPFRLFGLPPPPGRRWLLVRRACTVLQIACSHLARTWLAGRLARAGISR